MNRTRLAIVLDCEDPVALAPFWAAVLGYRVEASGLPYTVLVGDGPELLLQAVPEPKTGKNRVHLDIRTDDLDREVERVVALGAQIVDDGPVEEAGWRWRILADPQGNEFCVLRPRPA